MYNMPNYQFACSECSFNCVMSLSINARDSFVVCPECSGKLIRLFSPVNFILKGGGFYSTDK